MMSSRQELEAELLARLQIANNSTQFPAARVTQLIQDAHTWAGSLYFWPSLYRSRIFSSTPNTQSLKYDYYDYPVDMLTNSISRLYINGKKYEKKAFQDFLDYVDQATNNALPPDDTKYYFAEFSRQFFVWPAVTVAGSSDGIVWGNVQPSPLANPTDNTIFALWDDSGNEAVLKKGMSVAMARLDSGFAASEKAEAVALLGVMWKKITAELQRSQRLDHPFFNTHDYFGPNSGQSTIANFNVSDVIF